MTRVEKTTRKGFQRYYRWAAIDGAGFGLVAWVVLGGIPWLMISGGAIMAVILVRIAAVLLVKNAEG